MCPSASQMKPDPVPVGTSTAARRKGSTMVRLLVTNTVAGATASNTLIELRSSSVLAPGPSALIPLGAGATGAGAGAAGKGAAEGAAGGGLGLGAGSPGAAGSG